MEIAQGLLATDEAAARATGSAAAHALALADHAASGESTIRPISRRPSSRSSLQANENKGVLPVDKKSGAR